MTTVAQVAHDTLHRVEGRIKEMPIFQQSGVYNLAQVIEEFVKTHGAVGHVALNLTTARMAVEVL